MAEEGSALDLEGFEKRLQSLFTNGCSSHALQVDGKTFCSGFRKLVEEYTCHWQTPLPQLRVLEIALCYFDRESYSFPVGCDDVHYMLSSLALSVFELLLFFDKNDFDQDPLKHFTVTFQECHMSLASHQNVHLLEVINCLQDGGPWGNATLQSILTQSTLPQTEVDRYISAQVPVLLELRVRYLLTCERISEAMALAKCCSQHPTAGEHPFFLQVYLTWLHKTSQNDLLNKELTNLNGKDALHVICNMESEEEDESLLALTRAFLSQELRRGDMDHLCDLVFIWSKLHMRLKTSKQVLLEESHELMLSATNVHSIFPFIRVILEELGNDGLQFCVELCTKALQSCDDVGTKSLIYKTIAGLFPNDLEMCRACALLVYFLEPTVEAYKMVFQLYTQPDQEFNADASPISNKVRFELLQVLKKGLHFDPEFCDLMSLRANCKNLMSETAENAALEEILECVPDNSIKEPDLHLSIHSSYFQQRTEVAHQAGAKKRQTKGDKKSHIIIAAVSASSVDHAVMMKEKRAVNETPALDSLWQSFWQVDQMYNSLIPPRFSEKKRPRRKIRKPGWLMEYSETAEDLEKASTSSETHEDLDEASTSFPSGKPRRLMENSETHEDLEEASTSLLNKIKPAVVVLSRLPRINKASTLLLIKMKSAVVVLNRLPQIDKASSSLLAKINPAAVVLPKLPQLHEASSSLLVNEAVLDKLPQIDDRSISPSQTPPAVVVLPEHSSQAAPWPLVPLQQCIREGEGVSVGSEGEDTVSVGSDTCWDPKWDQDSEPECKQSETLMPQANYIGLMSPAPELTRTGQGRDSSPHPGVTSQTSQTLVFSCPECLFAFTSKAFLHRHMKRCLKDIYCQLNGQIPSAACQQITSTACVDLVPPVPVVTLGDESPPSTLVPGDPPCISSATDPKRGDTDQQIPYSNQRFIKTLFIKTLTLPGEVKTRHLIHTGKKPHPDHLHIHTKERLSDNLRTHLIHNGQKRFSCKVCAKNYSSKGNLKMHLRIHTGEKPFSCKVCANKFSSNGNLKMHLRIHTGEKPFSCKVCANNFSSKRNLKIHLRSHTGEKAYDSKDCGKCFSQSNNLKQHTQLHTGEKPFHFKVCEKNFSLKGDLKMHLRIHTGENPFRCTVCGMSFSQKGHLKRHLRTHTVEKPYDSNVCGENLGQKDNLKNHLCTHTGEKPYDSKDCGKCYSRANNLNQHMQVHTGEKPLRCKVCGKNFSWKRSLKRHLRTHTAEKLYDCKDCDKHFSQKSNLKKHLLTHTGEKPYDCKDCGKNFSQKSNLKKHLCTHTGEKTYDTKVCEKNLCQKVKENLKKHLHIHTAEKTYDCKVCGKNFCRKDILTKHLRTHTGEKPYDCKDCGKNFAWKESLKRHIRINHTGKKPYDSNVCGENLGQKDNLKNHLCTHTGEKPSDSKDCGKCYSRANNLNQHMQVHTGEKPLRCKVCGKNFSWKGNLNRHLRTHTAEKPFRCTVCGKYFSRNCYLKIHLRTHTGEKTNDCKDCGKNFSWKESLKRHHTGEKPYDSNVCGENLCQKDNLKNHLCTHTGEKPYDSKDCGNCYSRANNLNQHMQVHTGEKPLRCKVCGKNFSWKGSLKRHIRIIHTGEKTYDCKDCGKNFVWKDSLRRHIRNIHTGEKPYDCKDCGKNFVLKANLNRHISIIHTGEKQHLRTHTTEKPYRCTVCAKNFSWPSYLKIHLRTHTGEKPYDCKDCGKNFVLKDSLWRHIRNIHTGEKQHLRIHTGERPYDCKDCGKHFNDGHHLDNHECFHLFDDPNPGVPNYGHDITGKHSQTMADQQAHGTWEHDILVDRMWVGDMCEISTDYAHDDALVTGEINGHATGDAHNALVDDIIEIMDHDYL